MKKITIFLCAAAAAALAVSLAACNSSGSSAAPSPTPPATATPTPLPDDILNQPVTIPEGGSEVDGAMGVDPGTGEDTTPDTELATTLESIYGKKDPGLMLATTAVNLTDASWMRYYTGLEGDAAAKLDAAVASEAAIGSQAYSLVLARVVDPADAAATAQAMLDGIDPVKWVCVQADDIRAVTNGSTVMLVMVDSGLSDAVTAQELVDAFTEVVGAPETDLTRSITAD